MQWDTVFIFTSQTVLMHRDKWNFLITDCVSSRSELPKDIIKLYSWQAASGSPVFDIDISSVPSLTLVQAQLTFQSPYLLDIPFPI